MENILNSLFLIPVRLRKFFLLIIYFLSLSNYGCYAKEKWITVYSGRKDYLDRGSKKIDVDSIKKSSDGYVFYIIRREVGTHSRFNSSPDGGILYTASNWGAVSCENRTIFTQIKAGSVYGKKIGLKGEEFIFNELPIDRDPRIYDSKTHKKIYKLVCKNHKNLIPVKKTLRQIYSTKNPYSLGVYEKRLKEYGMTYKEFNEFMKPKFEDPYTKKMTYDEYLNFKKNQSKEPDRSSNLRNEAHNNCLKATDYKGCFDYWINN